jgi:glycosyltransferase involved in cell wall biosynthesis
MSSPAISVVIPTHGGRFVAAAVNSVITQTIGDWELIIVDDGSQDGTAELAARFAAADSRIRVVAHPRNLGIVAARNRGLGAISAASRYIAFLDHDDVWAPIALELLRAELVAQPAAAAAHGTAIAIDEEGRPHPPGAAAPPSCRSGIVAGRLMPWPSNRPTEFANLAYDDCIVSMGSGLIRRTSLDHVGRFDPRAERADDYDMWIRLSRAGPIAFVDHAVLGYRVHDDQTSRRPAAPRGRGPSYVRYKTIASLENTPEQRRLAIAGFRAYHRRFLGERWSDARAAWARGHYSEVRRFLAHAARHALAYTRGRPWSWHR